MEKLQDEHNAKKYSIAIHVDLYCRNLNYERKKEFTIDDFDEPLTEANQKGRAFRINLIRQIVDFCQERGYRVVYVIPPVTEYLDHYFTPKFKQTLFN